MEIVVHYPTDQTKCTELAQRVAKLHADAVLHHIQKLSCPNNQKAELLEAILTEKRKGI